MFISSSPFLFTFLKIVIMTKSRKLLLGILSLLPLVFMVFYFIVFFSFFFTIMRQAQYDGDIMPPAFFRHIAMFVGLALLMGLTQVGLLIYFIIHDIGNKAVDSTERIIWILVFIFIGMIGFPLYWWMRIWNADDRSMRSEV